LYALGFRQEEDFQGVAPGYSVSEKEIGLGVQDLSWTSKLKFGLLPRYLSGMLYPKNGNSNVRHLC
jgi:hypothetical protein